MKIHKTALAGVVVVDSVLFVDHRGSFTRCYCEQELAEIIGSRRIVQINHSITATAGAVRGMHFQHPPRSEMKLVRCIKGRVWDVAVDLRTNSNTFLKWHAEELTPENARMMVIPEGCAHGFQALEAGSELLYLHTQFYSPAFEGGVSCTDTILNIPWPMPISDLSQRDCSYPLIKPDFSGIPV